MTYAEQVEAAGSIKAAVRAAGMPETTFRRRLRKEQENIITHEDTTKNRYVYDEKQDLYVFHLASRDDPYQIPGETFRQIVWDYPRTGANKTKGQIALEYGMPLPLLEIVFRTYGLYKHGIPYTNEDFEGKSEDERAQMQDDTIEKRKHNWMVDLDKREKVALGKEVKSLRKIVADNDGLLLRMEESVDRVMKRLGPAPKRVKSRDVMGGMYAGESFDGHAPLTDLHGGMFAWHAETWGGNWDTKIAASVDVAHASAVAEFFRGIGGKLKELWSTDIGDHFNGLDLATMHGTPQEQDGRAFKVFDLMFEAAVKKIEIMRSICEYLRIRFVPGNHDHIHQQHFFHSLSQRYFYCDDVELVAHPRWQESFRVGKSLHTLDHGQGFPRDVGSDKAISMAKRTVRNSGGEDYYETRYHHLYLGHLHNEGRAEDDNLKVYRLPAATDQTDWENRNRWTADPSARVWVLDSLGRPELEMPLRFQAGRIGER